MQQEELNSAEVSGYGLRAKFAGTDLKFIIGIIFAVSITVFMLYEWDKDRATDKEARAVLAQEHKTTQALVASVISRNEIIIDMLKQNKVAQQEGDDAIIFVLTRTEAQRQALKLEMPQSLRRKLIER